MIGKDIKLQKEQRKFFWENSCTHHNSDDFNANVTVLSQNIGDLTKRLITEFIMIDELIDEELMNSMEGWEYVRLPSASITTS